jgi:poly(3-hydroxyalkanoate) depolymerase
LLTGIEIRTVDLNGQLLRVGVRRPDAGTALASPPLVIFNGIGANLELVEPFVAALAGVEVIVFDIPGVGASPAPLLPYRFTNLANMTVRLLKQLGYTGQVDVIGVSWGGALAQQFAFLHPHLCRRLILAATAPGVIMVPGKLSVLAKLISPRRYTDPEFLSRIGAQIYGGAYRRDAELLRDHSRHIRSPRSRGYLYQLVAGMGWSSLPWLMFLRQRTLVLHGKDDPIVPLVNARILAFLIRDATLHIVDDGHLFLISQPTEMAALIGAFLSDDGQAS